MPILLVRRAPALPPEETDPYATYEVGGVPVDPPDYERSGAHQTAGISAATNVFRRDASGNSDAGGSIGILGLGMSNARLLYDRVKVLHAADAAKQPGSVFVNGARDGATQEAWRDAGHVCWTNAATKVTEAGLTAAQVQIVWLSIIQKNPHIYGNLTTTGMDAIVTNLMASYPNTKLLYLSPIGYTGFARALDPSSGNYKLAPVADVYADALFLADLVATAHDFPGSAWVDYFPVWANGSLEDPLTGLTYLAEDIQADGVHPSITTGQYKLAANCWNRLKVDPVLEDKVWT